MLLHANVHQQWLTARLVCLMLQLSDQMLQQLHAPMPPQQSKKTLIINLISILCSHAHHTQHHRLQLINLNYGTI